MATPSEEPKFWNPGWELISNSIPNDIALNIASFLEASDVCSLGSCCKFWCDLCASDCLWFVLVRKRWPDLSLDSLPSSPLQGWRGFYISNHRKLASCVSVVIKFVEQCTHNESIEVGNYLKAIGDLRSMELGFKDVQLLFLARKQSVLLNLIGLHFSLIWLGIPLSDLMEALCICRVSERQVCVSWFKLGRWFYGFRLHDEHRSRKVSLGELATASGEEVLGVLNRGAIHEVLRVHITSVSTAKTSSQSMGSLY